VVIVIGHAANDVRAALEPLVEHPQLSVVYNPEYEEGQASSIRRGLKALPGDADAAMFLTCDQPLVSVDLINALIQTFEQHRPLICYPVFGTNRSTPSIFAAKLFPELQKLTGDVGGRVLIEKYKSQVREHKIASWRALADVDTENDFESLKDETSDLRPQTSDLLESDD
jgi:molybdenum cofactor cytidylyltransferase